MDERSGSLIDRLKAAEPEAVDWEQLQRIQLPLIQRWPRRVPSLGIRVDDLAQDVFLVVIRELPQFERRREGSFRAWLRTITANSARNYCKYPDRRPTVEMDQAEWFRSRCPTPLAIWPASGTASTMSTWSEAFWRQ